MEKKQGWDEFRKRLNEPPEMTDTLIRHKWPEEKPPISGSRYLVLIDREYTSFIDILFWGGSDWVRFKHNDDRTYIEADDDVTHWWELPEV